MTIRLVGGIRENKTRQLLSTCYRTYLEQLHVLIEVRVNFIGREDLKDTQKKSWVLKREFSRSVIYYFALALGIESLPATIFSYSASMTRCIIFRTSSLAG